MQHTNATLPNNELVPDPVVRREFNVSSMTLYRWDADPAKGELGWPPKIKIGDRNYRSRALLEEFKANVLRSAFAARAGKAAA
jgi:hypothetical protein